MCNLGMRHIYCILVSFPCSLGMRLSPCNSSTKATSYVFFLFLYCCRHESYVNQYRAMFVLNCCVLRDEVLKYIPKADKRSRRRKRRKGKEEKDETEEKKGEDLSQETEPEIYHPVRCGECNTEVAVFDKQEIFHFFNVLASAP